MMYIATYALACIDAMRVKYVMWRAFGFRRGASLVLAVKYFDL